MLRLSNCSKAFGTKAILADQSYHFPQNERIALVGDNGAGKTTVLNCISGIDHFDNGEVILGKDMILGYLPQEPNSNPKGTVLAECEAGSPKILKLKDELELCLKLMESGDADAIERYNDLHTEFTNLGGYQLTMNSEKVLTGLGFDRAMLDQNPRELSGGWRMRVELAKLLVTTPSVLILDEPTNHLDLPSLMWVERYLQSYRGTLIFVSHDRSLLNRLATITLHLDHATLTPYTGGYDAFLTEKARRLEQSQQQHAQLEKKKQQLQTFVDRFGAKATKAAQAASKEKVIAKIKAEQTQLKTSDRQSKVRFRLPEPLPVERIPLTIKGGAIGYGQPLATGINLEVEKGQKIAVVGANGVGKSTLLKTICNKIPGLAGEFERSDRCEIAYFAQEQLEVLDGDRTVLDNVLNASSLAENEVRRVLGSFLFSGDDVKKPIKVLSGGEKSRVGLACILVRGANLLLLDEPTNHLDMKSCEHLVSSLREYKGTVIFVSHDRFFINSLCSHVLAMSKTGETWLAAGNLDDYERKVQETGIENVLRLAEDSPAKKSASKSDSKKDQVDRKQQQQQIRKLEKELAQSERRQEKLRLEISNLSNELHDIHPHEYELLTEVAEKKHTKEQELQKLEGEWLEISERLGGI